MKLQLDHKLVTIYTLTNPVTGLIFYVGQTTMPLLRRLHCHWTVRGQMNDKYELVINELRKMRRRPIIEEIDTCHYKDKRSIECFWVQTISGWGFDLTNHRHNTNKGYIPRYERKRQRDLRMKVMTDYEFSLMKELYRPSDPAEIVKNLDCTAERVRQIIHSVVHNDTKKIPIWQYDHIIGYYNKRAKFINDIYLQNKTHVTVTNP